MATVELIGRNFNLSRGHSYKTFYNCNLYFNAESLRDSTLNSTSLARKHKTRIKAAVKKVSYSGKKFFRISPGSIHAEAHICLGPIPGKYFEKIKMQRQLNLVIHALNQGILKGEVSLYH